MGKRRCVKSEALSGGTYDNAASGGKRSKYFKSPKNPKYIEDQGDEKKDEFSSDPTSDAQSSNMEAVGNSSPRCDFKFYDKPCKDLAKQLLGKTLVRILDSGERLSGVIVETEAYIGGEDKGSHSFQGKRTSRNEAMYMDPGTAYVYHIYGMYTCINISSRGEGAAVLIRGLDAVDGFASMRTFRGKKRADGGSKLKLHELCNGPSKLTQALSVSKVEFDQKDLCQNKSLWVEDGEQIVDANIISCSRIGIDYAGDWASAPLRFYIRGKKGVSVRDKVTESNLDRMSSSDAKSHIG